MLHLISIVKHNLHVGQCLRAHLPSMDVSLSMPRESIAVVEGQQKCPVWSVAGKPKESLLLTLP